MTEEGREDKDIERKEEGQGQLRRLPNPGGVRARALGCTCPIVDNNYGYYPPDPPDGWWITVGCPVHSPDPSTGDGDEPF